NVIPDPGRNDGSRSEFKGLSRGGCNEKSEIVIVGLPLLAQVESFEVTRPRVLFENDVLVTGGRGARAGGIQAGKTNPGFDGEICGMKSSRVGKLNVAVGSVEREC